MTEEESVETGFRKALDAHGYGFQYAVLRRIEELSIRGQGWSPLAPEFAVEVRGRDTRIDFILTNNSRRWLMICECKRANPATANWCFAKATWPRSDYRLYIWTPVIEQTAERTLRTSLKRLLPTDNAFQIALEIRTRQKGDRSGSGRGEVEEAASQVCRSLNGLINFLASRDSLLPAQGPLTLMPVVFTTATLWTSTVSLSAADVETGKLPLEELGMRRADWVWLDYPQSGGIQHSVQHERTAIDLKQVFYEEIVRRIAIVSPSGIEEFLTSEGLWSY